MIFEADYEGYHSDESMDSISDDDYLDEDDGYDCRVLWMKPEDYNYEHKIEAPKERENAEHNESAQIDMMSQVTYILKTNDEAFELFRSALGDNFGYTALMFACTSGDRELLSRVLDMFPMDFNSEGGNLLLSAIIGGSVEVVEILLQHGANVHAVKGNKEKMQPLHLAANRGHLEIAELLLRNGADPNANELCPVGALHFAIMNGKLEMVKLLLKHGADAEGKDNQDRTPLMHADLIQMWDIVEALVEHGVDIHVFKLRPLLHTAAIEGRMRLVRMILQLGEDINLPDEFGKTTFYAGCLNVEVNDMKPNVTKKIISHETGWQRTDFPRSCDPS